MPSALLPLLEMKRWLLWCWELKPPRKKDGGKPRDPANPRSWTKPPKCPNGTGGLRGAATDRDDDLTVYADVVPYAAAGLAHGVGFAPRAMDGLLFVDLDGCREPETGAVAGWAQRVVTECGSYCEVSPSGRGLRVIGLADGWSGGTTKSVYSFAPPEGGEAGGEIYVGANYVTVSFVPWGGQDRLVPIGAAAARLMALDASSGSNSVGAGGAGSGLTGGAGGDPIEAPVEVIRETLGMIPNDGSRAANWSWWKERVGMAVFAATGGSDEGLIAWAEWSEQHPDYGDGATCEEEWDRLRMSPPTRNSGFAAVFAEARRAQGEMGRMWNGGDRWRAWKAGFGALPPVSGNGADHGGNGSAPPGSSSTANAYSGGGDAYSSTDAVTPRQKPTIQMAAGLLPEIADMAEQALVAGGFPIYVRIRGRLVAPDVRKVGTGKGAGKRDTMMAGLHAVDAGWLRDMLGQAANWVKWDGRAKALVRCDASPDVLQVLLARPNPRPFPEASGIVSTPGLWPDGTIATAGGYDPVLRVHRIVDPGLRLPPGWATRSVVRADAEAALGELDGLLEGFPFVEGVDRVVALALILTCLCRASLGASPAFGLTAPTPGTGKSHLADLAAMIATGQRAPAAGVSERGEETEKRLGGLIAAGYPIISLDNVNGTLRSDLLAQATERTMVQIRLLGSSDMPIVECRSVFIVNGNGLRMSGDLVRRTLPCRLDAGVEQPERRRFAFDPVERVRGDRGRYVAAGLTVLRAHALAGMPGEAGLRPLGSYGEWSGVVRGALAWLGREDPAEAMERARAEDPELRTLRDMLDAWRRRLGEESTFTIRQAIEAAQGILPAGVEPADGEAGRDLLEAFSRAAGARGVIDAQKLGYWLVRNEGRIGGGWRFVRGTQLHSTARWGIERATPDIRVVK